MSGIDVPSNKSWIYPSEQRSEIDRLRAELEQERTESSEWERLAHKYQDERNQAEARVRELEEAARPFAEKPHDGMKDYPCHTGILDDPEKCGRCGRAIRLWKALANSEKEPDHD